MANMRSWSRCVSQNTTLHFQIIGEKRKTYIYCISFFKYFKESQQGEEVVGDDCGPFFFFQISRSMHIFCKKGNQANYVLLHTGSSWLLSSSVLLSIKTACQTRCQWSPRIERGLRQLLPRPNDLQMLTRAPYGPWAWPCLTAQSPIMGSTTSQLRQSHQAMGFCTSAFSWGWPSFMKILGPVFML